ncbi:PREDICTED: WD repeat-containing protein 34-like [Nicrophorus vespilloides]|uniref:Dynein axonemal intermediate chain 4 n=1 Tax=Nicrophorus vespilloides TaxID=110193 RepID=A0ABM1N2L8_NICVS|nr:PREDICTED: WD repeat-containing protein 34-like [Nicrophorus vespilloides]
MKPNDVAMNTQETKEIEIQTDEPESKPVEYDEQKLADFLSKMYPKMQEALDDSVTMMDVKRRAFAEDKTDIKVKLLQEIRISNENLQICAMCWNSTGNSIAISSTYEHQSWCHHKGTVNVYTLNREDLLPDAPQKILHASACVTTLRFHPTITALLAGGSRSGEILLWNIQLEESVVLKVNAHEEIVTQISWVNDIDLTSNPLLATSSLDGFLNLWRFNSTTNSLDIKDKYKIKSPLFGRLQRKSELPLDIARKVDRGVIGFDFSKFEPHMFVVAAEGGLVARCSMLGTKTIKGSAGDCPISDPVYKYYTAHEGEITTILFSPNRREMFMTNGSDGEIRIYVLNQEEAAQVIFIESPIKNVAWIPHEEKLLAACGVAGFIEIFDVLKGKSVDYSIDEKYEKSVMNLMEINSRRINTVIVGSAEGILQLWTIPWHLYSRKP